MPEALDFEQEPTILQQMHQDYDKYTKDDNETVDSDQNVDTMGILDVLREKSTPLNADTLIKRAYDSLYDGNLEDAAELFNQAIAQKPPRQAEFKIAIQLCNIYKNLGYKELALDILVSYKNHYGADLSENDMAAITASILDMDGTLDA
jgi:tetratricopeptide (TPR) repeat protein